MKEKAKEQTDEQKTLADAMKEIDVLEDVENPSDLTRDLSVLRFVVNRGLASKNYSLVCAAEATIARTAREWLRQQCINSRYISVAALGGFLEEVNRVYTKHLQEFIHDDRLFPVFMDIAADLAKIQMPRNDAKAVRRLEFNERP